MKSEKNKQLSHHHHYLPQCYIKGFLNNNGNCYQLRKDLGKIDSNIHSTYGVFYQTDRNTTIHNGEKTDFVENLYSQIDDAAASYFQAAMNGAQEEELVNADIIVGVKQLIANLFFRLPIGDQYIEGILNNFDYSRLRNRLVLNGNVLSNDEIKRMFLSSKDKETGFRDVVLSNLLFDCRKEYNPGHWYIFDTEKNWEKHLLSDNPIIFDDPTTLLNFSGILIFPLTKNRTLIHTKENIDREKIPSSFTTMIDIFLIAKAENYIVGPDKEYLNEIYKLYNETLCENGRIIMEKYMEFQYKFFDYLR